MAEAETQMRGAESEVERKRGPGRWGRSDGGVEVCEQRLSAAMAVGVGEWSLVMQRLQSKDQRAEGVRRAEKERESGGSERRLSSVAERLRWLLSFSTE